MRMSLRWRLTAFYVGSMAVMFLLLAVFTHRHLDHELREEAVERAHPGHEDWLLHADFLKQEIDDILGELFEIWSIIALPVLGLSLFAGMILARNSLRPVQKLNRQLASIGPANLGERVVATDADPEIRRLEGQINGLLERVESGFERLTSYSTSVAHELRTPIMLMRLQIERSGQKIEPNLAEDLQEELARLGHYIERTLLSARAEQGRFDCHPQDFDLTSSIRDLAEGHVLLAGESGRVIRVDAPSPLVVHSDPAAFRHIFDNLVVNALHHGHDDVAIRLRRRGDNVVLLIVNSVQPQRAPANPGTGAGVGLRLISALVHALPGARYRSHAGTGFYAATLTLPVAASTAV